MEKGCKDCFSDLLIKLMPKSQYEAMIGSSEHREAVLEMSGKVEKMPGILETEGQARHILVLHYFNCSCDWFICEWDREDTFFGFVNNEWGNISRKELLALEPESGDVLNLDFHCSYKTIEDVINEHDS